jgi:hypothetical protein
MVLSPKAFRFVADSVDQLPDQRFRQDWAGAKPDTPLNEAQVDAALYAVEQAIKRDTAKIERLRDDEDARSDLINEVMYLKSIDRLLRYGATTSA